MSPRSPSDDASDTISSSSYSFDSSNNPPTKEPRILLIDAYDSFTHNLADQISRTTRAKVHTIHIDSPYTDISDLLPHLLSFDAVVLGPGPGTPSNPVDVGVSRDIWRLAEENLLPVFGVCLGLQSLCLEYGGKVERLNTVKHGLTAEIRHTGEGLFEGVGETVAVRYHSLHASLDAEMEGVLEPLAWVMDEENGEVLMAVRHKGKPFWAVQYHPESICTEGGDKVVENFWRLAKEWNKAHGRRTAELLPSWTIRPREPSLLEQVQLEGGAVEDEAPVTGKTVETVSLMARGIDITRLCELLGSESADEFVLLDSAAHPGEWSIIGVLSPGITRLFRYHVGDSFLTHSIVGGDKSTNSRVPLKAPYNSSVWRYLASYMQTRKATGGEESSPFWGGLIGYFSYELGVDSLSIPLPSRPHRHPDINLAFIERSIAINTLTGQTYIQTLLPSDTHFLTMTRNLISQARDLSFTPSTTPPPPGALPSTTPISQEPLKPTIHLPSATTYKSLVRHAQSFLSTGDSYELCLTARTRILLPSPSPSPWALYTSLRHRNPAPYASFLRLQGTTLLSSSPERFLSFSRHGRVQLRPIKGTVRKTPTTTFAQASAILSTPKERAENLMILDLIRHDLHRILGPGQVDVEQCMSVEEYKTVYQLVSVITGRIPAELRSGETPLTGLDVLATSLPPGSMTGAPKKRSVEILRDLEEGMEERGVYSGVVGYLSVCGAGDWSVVIRSAVRYDDDNKAEDEDEEWWIGAGGAVTALSTPEGEWEEMKVKLESTLRAFCG